MSSKVVSSLVEELRSATQGRVVSAEDATYDAAREVWNGAVDHHPALVAFCETVQDVQSALYVAVNHGLPISVRGGGYDWAGRSVRTGGLVIDLSPMKKVSVDAHGKIATVQGGATAGDVIAAATPHGLAAVVGTMSKIGMAGLTLAGGYGPLSTRFGLALDNLLSAELVLADGRQLRASSSENPDLFWALRGGGGNFGVVTSMEIRLHPVQTVLTGKILFPWSDVQSVLNGYTEIMSSAPDELSITVGVGSAPDGSSAVFMAPFWSGDLTQGEQIVANLQGLGTPLLAAVRPTDYDKVFGLFEGSAPAGRYYMQQTRWLPTIIPEVITSLIDAVECKTSPFSLVAVQSFHGAPSRIPLHDTAFGLRRKHFMAGIIVAWTPDDSNPAKHQQWSRDVSQGLAPYALPGGYPNLLGPDERVQIDAAYGSNIGRLREVKRRFDPDNLFAATPLPL
jgi:FAD/FMN-containing dehydrogenase